MADIRDKEGTTIIPQGAGAFKPAEDAKEHLIRRAGPGTFGPSPTSKPDPRHLRMAEASREAGVEPYLTNTTWLVYHKPCSFGGEGWRESVEVTQATREALLEMGIVEK